MTDLSQLTITEVTIPQTLDAPDAADFHARLQVRNAIETEILGSDALNYRAEEVLPGLQDQRYNPTRLFLARLDGEPVGKAAYAWPVEGGVGATMAWIEVGVLSPWRNRGIGTKLADVIEQLAVQDGRTSLQVYMEHTAPKDGDPTIASPTGFGVLNANDPGVRFLQHRGYSLEQIERISFLDLPVAPEMLAENRAKAEDAAGPDYRVIRWLDATPDDRIADMIVLRTRMSTDMPSGGMDAVEEAWDEERIRNHDAQQLARGRTSLTVAAEHIPSGRLAGFSTLQITADHTRPVFQQDTLVLSEHRGHRLGMLLKVANIQYLQELAPDARLITTFNAEENRFMLNVNEAVGFRPVASQGAWKKLAS